MNRLQLFEKRLDAIEEWRRETPDWPNWNQFDVAMSRDLVAITNAVQALLIDEPKYRAGGVAWAQTIMKRLYQLKQDMTPLLQEASDAPQD